MVQFDSPRFFRALLPAVMGLLASCATLHETDMAANRGYSEFGGAPAYKPSLASPRAGTVATAKKKQVKYSPMVERTATGVRVVDDYSTRSRNKSVKANAAQVQAARSQQNSRMAKAYNDNNLLTR